ncbi:hypothetical protein MM1S1540310_0351 [Mycobacteroides abscessus subsp. bolletii 1S-154-0310]|nr:hypothetical protein MM1S1540310_0351 [Mycobacteroides abscessus subsp. bolletii 1S-154-0310]
MYYRGVGAGPEQAVDHNVPVALGVVLLEAEQRDHTIVEELADVGEGVRRGGGVEDFSVSGQGLGFAGPEPGAVVLRVAQGAVVNVIDPGGAERLGELRLRKPGLAAERSQSYVNENAHVLFEQLGNKMVHGLTFVADADQGPHGYDSSGSGLSGAHGS